MNKLISKVTLIAFIYQSLLAPLAATEASCPTYPLQAETAVVQIGISQDNTTAPSAEQGKVKKVTQHTATASTLTPWKRALEYYRWGQYQEMAGEICTSIVGIGMMILIPAMVIYVIYKHYTGLNAFEEAASGVQSGTMEAMHYKADHPNMFNPENILSLFTAVVAKDSALLQSIWHGQSYYFTNEHIPTLQRAKIINTSHFLQSAFQDAPPRVWGVSTRFCSSDNNPLHSPVSQFIHYHEVIDGAEFPNDCPNDGEVHLIIPRHHAFDKKDPHFYIMAKTAFQKRMKAFVNATSADALEVAKQTLLSSQKLQGDIQDEAGKRLSKEHKAQHNHDLVQMMNRNLWGVVQEAPNTVSSLLIQHCMHKNHFVGEPTLQFIEYGQSYRNNGVPGCNRENTVHTIMNRGHHDKDVSFEALSTFSVAYENDHGMNAGEPLKFSDRRMLLQSNGGSEAGVNGTDKLETLHNQFLLNANVTRFLTEVFGMYKNNQCLGNKLKKDVQHAMSPFYGVFDSTDNKVVSFFMNIVGATGTEVDHLNVQFDDANFDPNNLKPIANNTQVGSCYVASRHHNNGFNLRVSLVEGMKGDIDISYGLKKQADSIITAPPASPIPESTNAPTPVPTPQPTNPCGEVDPTQLAFNTTQGIHDLFDYRLWYFHKNSAAYSIVGASCRGDFKGGFLAIRQPANLTELTINITCAGNEQAFWSPFSYWPGRSILGCKPYGGDFTIKKEKYGGLFEFLGVGACKALGAVTPRIHRNFGLNADHIISYFNTTNTTAAQISHVLGQMHAVLMADQTSTDAQEIVPLYNHLVAHYSNVTQAGYSCFATAKKVLDKAEVGSCIDKLKLYYAYSGFVNATGLDYDRMVQLNTTIPSNCSGFYREYPRNMNPFQLGFFAYVQGQANATLMGNYTQVLNGLSYASQAVVLNLIQQTQSAPAGISQDVLNSIAQTLLTSCATAPEYPKGLSTLENSFERTYDFPLSRQTGTNIFRWGFDCFGQHIRCGAPKHTSAHISGAGSFVVVDHQYVCRANECLEMQGELHAKIYSRNPMLANSSISVYSQPGRGNTNNALPWRCSIVGACAGYQFRQLLTHTLGSPMAGLQGYTAIKLEQQKVSTKGVLDGC